MDDHQVQLVFCSCNSTCSRKQTTKEDKDGRMVTKGCQCKAKGIKCTDQCNCGTKKKGTVVKPCKNGRPQATASSSALIVVANVSSQPAPSQHPDGYIRMEEELDQEDKRIQDYLEKLNQSQLIEIIKFTTNQGCGTLKSIQDVINEISYQNQTTDPDAPEPEPAAASVPWCVCGQCKEMPTIIECKCCRRKNCVSKYNLFQKYCIDKDNLIMNIKARCDIRADKWNFETNELRKAAYRQYTLWKYGKLSKGDRRVVPSCCVLKVRAAFPSRDGTYMGFKPN